MPENILQSELKFLKGIGADRADALLAELGMRTFEDLLNFFPFRYIDRTEIIPIKSIKDDMPFIQVKGIIESVNMEGKGSKQRMKAILRDETGRIELVWFQGIKWLKETVKKGQVFIAFGRPGMYKNMYTITHPELDAAEAADDVAKIKIQPVYSSTEKLKVKGLDSRGIMKLQKTLLEKVHQSLQENLPENLLKKFRLIHRRDAYIQVHFPQNMEWQKMAAQRLKFEELFFIQIKILRNRNKRKEVNAGFVFDVVGEYFNNFYTNFLPFQLTTAQKKVIKEIRADTRTGKQMNRLLQGDVGSGKTMVAFLSMLIALDNQTQACMMAPTEILATQHFLTLTNISFGTGINIRLLTGSTTNEERKRIEQELKEGILHILVGTHALIEDWVNFRNLGLVVIDEQHRFGVAQRAKLWMKNAIVPHILVMTATPIPRTLAMTLYGDLEASVIDELPPGRKDIITKHSFENRRKEIYQFLRKQLASGRQAYVVFPLIEESETLDYNNLVEGAKELRKNFPEFNIAEVHGRMSSDAKEEEMQKFKKGETNILVSTTVIEVGVDVPNATVMVIESAERFGLSQLHQLRGRVGRGAHQSYCILLSGNKLSADGRTRMETMVRTNNGFEISEVDLQLRGPGDLMGTRQSGLLNLKIADLALDQKILQAARHAALEVLDDDPHLSKAENKNTMNYLTEMQRNSTNWGGIS